MNKQMAMIAALQGLVIQTVNKQKGFSADDDRMFPAAETMQAMVTLGHGRMEQMVFMTACPPR